MPGPKAPSPFCVRLHVDADRDGKVDDDATSTHKWTWGPGGRGAVALVNSDADSGLPQADYSDSLVNGADDVKDLAPLELRCKGAIPPGTDVILSVDDTAVVRVFDSLSVAGKEILGPTAGASYVVPAPLPPVMHLGFEATRYADGGYDGIFHIELSLHNGTTKYPVQSVKIRAAPWMMLDHTRPAIRVYVSETAANGAFLTDLANKLASTGVPLTPTPTFDPWMQDCMEFGVSSSPTQTLPAVVRAPRVYTKSQPPHTRSELNDYARTLRSADLGFHDPHPETAPPDSTTFDSTGNLEVSPPVTSKRGKHYPFGRIYYGGQSRRYGSVIEEISPHLRKFLKAQRVQEPISLDTTWLSVGHVDEFMTFLPKGPKGFTLLLASPSLALDTLEGLGSSSAATIFQGRQWPHHGLIETSVGDLLKNGAAGKSWKELRKFNRWCQSRIDSSKKRLIRELGLDAPKDILEAPQLYIDAHGPDAADAFTGGMVNMLVVNGHCVVPQPFGPAVSNPGGSGFTDLFELDLGNKMHALGLTHKFVDCWDTYHVNMGEIHCGTNTLRQAPLLRWWEFKP